MAGTVLQSNKATSGATAVTTQACSFVTSNVKAGTKYVVAILGYKGLTSVKDGSNNSLTLLGASQDTIITNTNGLYIYAMDTPSAAVGTKPTITVVQPTAHKTSIIIEEVAGLIVGNTTAMIDGTWGRGLAASSTPTSPSYTSTNKGEHLISAYADTETSTVTWTAPAGYTLDSNNYNTGGTSQNLALAYKNSTGGSESASWTITGTVSWYEVLGAILSAPPIPYMNEIRRVSRYRASFY